jgi:hypothetical protein
VQLHLRNLARKSASLRVEPTKTEKLPLVVVKKPAVEQTTRLPYVK